MRSAILVISDERNFLLLVDLSHLAWGLFGDLGGEDWVKQCRMGNMAALWVQLKQWFKSNGSTTNQRVGRSNRSGRAIQI